MPAYSTKTQSKAIVNGSNEPCRI